MWYLISGQTPQDQGTQPTGKTVHDLAPKTPTTSAGLRGTRP